MDEDITFKVIKLIEKNPEFTQRQLAEELGVSLGKTNYCIRALIDKGLVKVKNFKNSNNKLAYAYLITPRAIEEKAAFTASFLKRKVAEYEQLRIEIEVLKREVEQSSKLK